MGCWNETCMISHLPIMNGESVYGVVLVQNKFCGGGCYPSDFWTPLFSIHGQYDDYGRIENVKRTDTKILWESMQKFGLKHFINEETGKALYTEADGQWLYENESDSQNSENPFSLLQFFQDIRNGAFFVSQLDEKQRLAIVFIKSSIKEKMDKIFFADESIASFRKDLLCKFDKLSVTQNQILHLESFDSSDAEKLFQHNILVLTYREIVTDLLRDMCCIPVAYDLYKEMSWIDFSFFTEMLLHLIMMNYILISLRMAWHIPSGTGSQSEVNYYMKALNKQIKKELKRLSSV